MKMSATIFFGTRGQRPAWGAVRDWLWRNDRTALELDDEWPESVEEQGLLLLVLRHYMTRQYIKDLI